MYAKIFTQIFDSSIADNWQHRHVFEDLLKLANPQGEVDMTVSAIVARTRMPRKMVVEAIKALCEPDPDSRTPEEDGRRLLPMDPSRSWGWIIVNYQKYRQIKSEFDRNKYMREYMRGRRVKPVLDESLTEFNKNVNPPSVSVSSSVQGNGDARGKGFPATIDSAFQQCALVDVPKDFIEHCFHKADSVGGVDARGRLITNFPAYVKTQHKYERDRKEREKMEHNSKGKQYRGDEKTLRQKQLDDVRRKVESEL